MAEIAKDHTQIEIKPTEPPFLSDFAGYELQEPRVPFFKSCGRRKQDTWAISLFVILHIVTFIATMVANDCSKKSHGECALKQLGKMSFQPLAENPLLGPSFSTLDEMGALRRTLLTNTHQTWRLFTCTGLHAGFIHLIINLGSVIYIGIHLEQEFGPLRIGIIYILSAFVGTLMAALFVQNSPSVCSSGALFGLLGTMLSGLVRNWNSYTKKFSALVALICISMINLALGLLPYVDNFSNIGGFISGFLLGFVLLFRPEHRQVAQNKGGMFDYGVKKSIMLKHKLDKPVLRSVSLVLYGLIFAGCLVAVLHGVNVNRYCSWCQYIDCIPSKRWSCNNKAIPCETVVSGGRLTLTCTGNGNFRVFPYTDISPARKHDLCSQICS